MGKTAAGLVLPGQGQGAGFQLHPIQLAAGQMEGRQHPEPAAATAHLQAPLPRSGPEEIRQQHAVGGQRKTIIALEQRISVKKFYCLCQGPSSSGIFDGIISFFARFAYGLFAHA